MINEEDYIKINNTIATIYSIKDEMEHKICTGEIRNASDKAELLEIKQQCLKALIDVLIFCSAEYDNTEHTQASVIMEIKYKISRNLNVYDPHAISLSLLERLFLRFSNLKNM